MVQQQLSQLTGVDVDIGHEQRGALHEAIPSHFVHVSLLRPLAPRIVVIVVLLLALLLLRAICGTNNDNSKK